MVTLYDLIHARDCDGRQFLEYKHKHWSTLGFAVTSKKPVSGHEDMMKDRLPEHRDIHIYCANIAELWKKDKGDP